MQGFGSEGLWVILIACVLIGLGFGFLIGFFLRGGGKNKAVQEAHDAHDAYREEVREHFEQTSAIMSRMVEDYREMYEHMSEGAGKLADMHPERVITPPPAPEAITARNDAKDGAADETGQQMDAPANDTDGEAVVAEAGDEPAVEGAEDAAQPQQPAEAGRDEAETAGVAESSDDAGDATGEAPAADAADGQAGEAEQPAEPEEPSEPATAASSQADNADATVGATAADGGRTEQDDGKDEDVETEKERARRLSGEAPERGEKTGGI